MISTLFPFLYVILYLLQNLKKNLNKYYLPFENLHVFKENFFLALIFNV